MDTRQLRHGSKDDAESHADRQGFTDHKAVKCISCKGWHIIKK